MLREFQNRPGARPSHGEEVPQGFVDGEPFLRADRADQFTETGQVDGRQLFDQHFRGRAIDEDFRPEVGWPGGRRRRGYHDSGQGEVVGLQYDGQT